MRAIGHIPLIVAGVVLSADPTWGQIASLVPSEPEWGDTVIVTYNPSAEDAKFSQRDEVHLLAFVHTGAGAEQRPARMSWNGERFTHPFVVQEGDAHLEFHFVTTNAWDRKANARTIVLRRDGKPARGAKLQTMFNAGPDTYRKVFDEEIALYPDHYAAYRTKWFLAGAFERQRVEEIVREDLASLTKRVEGEPIGFLYSLIFGRMTLGDEPAARAAVLKLLRIHPASELTERAVSDYDYQVYSRRIKGEGPQRVRQAVLAAIKQHPSSKLARDKMTSLLQDDEPPLDVLSAICRQWIDDQPQNPLPYYGLGTALQKHDRSLDEASRLIRTSIDLFLSGKYRLIADVSGARTAAYLPTAYRLWAKIAIQQKHYGVALAAARAAAALQRQTDGRAHTLEGRVWDALGNSDRAAKAYAEAIRGGDKDARGAWRAMYQRKHGSEDGFDEYAAELTKTVSKTDEKPLAKSFEATSLGGKKYDLPQLRGKVVVLNFWFIGCAPCRVEMPGLNKLVAEFEGKDVVFIAFATDPADDLREFIEKKPFDYEIIPAAGWIANLYAVTGFPTHVIIDQQGRVEARLVGGSEERHEDLRPIIQRLVGKG